MSIIEEWNERKRFATFFEKAMTQATQVSEDAKDDIEQRLATAKKLLDVADPLTRLKQWRSPEEIYELLPKSHWAKN